MKMTKAEKAHDRKVRNALCDLASKRLTLSDFLQQASALDPEIATALEGIYTGSEGRTHEWLPSRERYLVLTWYNKKVEVAYIS